MADAVAVEECAVVIAEECAVALLRPWEALHGTFQLTCATSCACGALLLCSLLLRTRQLAEPAQETDPSALRVSRAVDTALGSVPLGDVQRALAFLVSPTGRSGGEGWRRVGNGDATLRTFYGRGDSHHVIRCVAPFPTSVVAVVACVRELDLMPTWNAYTPHAQILHDWSPRHVCAVAQVWTPPAFPRARVVVDATLVDALDEHGCYVITATPLAQRPREDELPPPLRNLFELSVRVVATAKPVRAAAAGGAATCVSELVVFLPASLIPAWLLTFALYVGFPVVYRAAVKMLAAAAADGSALEARIRCGPHARLYADLRARCEAHLAAADAG